MTTGPDDEPMGPTDATEAADAADATERRLRAALAQRADRTEPADDALDRILVAADGAARRGTRRRSAALVAAAAAIVAVAAVAIAVSRPGPDTVDTVDDPGPTTTTAPSTTTGPDEPASTSTTTPEPTASSAPTTSTTPPTTTTAPTTTTTAPPPALSGASTGPVSGQGGADAIALVRDVRTGANDGFDRVVIEFLDGRLPDWSVSYVDPPITSDGSGETVAVAGDAFLLVRLSPASTYDLSGETPRPTYEGPGRVPGPGRQVVEVVRAGDFEAVSTWAIGVDAQVPFRVTTLAGPARLVIDVATG